MPVTGNTVLFDSTSNASMPQDALLFGASGWTALSSSWRLHSLGLPAQQIEQLASDLLGDGADDLVNPLAGDATSTGEDASGDPASALDGETGDGGKGGDGGSGE